MSLGRRRARRASSPTGYQDLVKREKSPALASAVARALQECSESAHKESQPPQTRPATVLSFAPGVAHESHRPDNPGEPTDPRWCGNAGRTPTPVARSPARI